MKIDKYALIFLGLSVLILWQGLLPGYLFGLDMVFGPEMNVATSTDGFLNGLIINYLIYYSSFIIPVWLIQKAILILLFFNIGYLAYKYLPLGENKEARMFSALIYLANPFVYSRFLAGQWTHLMAYAFFPLLFHCLLKLKEKNDLKSSLKVFGSILLISLFSIHYFVAVSLIFFGFSFYLLGLKFIEKKNEDLKTLIKNLLIGGVLFLIAISYWLIPALNRSEPLEQRLTESHWELFSGGNYKQVDTLLNIASLNGFWGERNPWAQYFVWPQDSSLFWLSFILITAIMIAGLIEGMKKKDRELILIFGILGVIAFILSTGAGETVFKSFNVFLFQNVPFWSGFRDSQKFSGFLALSYAFFAGIGFMAIDGYLKKKDKNISNVFLSFIFIVPILFGCYIWGGFYKQIEAVWYPDSWIEAKKIVQKEDGKILFLPWHLYLSLDFNNKVVSANPAQRFFGRDVISSRNVELGDIYLQESDQEYLKLDSLVTSTSINDEERIKSLKEEFGIRQIIKIDDLEGTDIFDYGFLASDKLETEFKGEGITVYTIKD